MPVMRDRDRMEAVVGYLREHGPSDVCTMRTAGLDVPNGLMTRMYQEGLVRRSAGGSRPRVWRLM